MAERMSLPVRAAIAGQPRDTREKATFINPNPATHLAREHQRQMPAQASQQQRHQHRHHAPRIPSAATRTIRCLAAAIDRASVAAAEAPGVIWPARTHPLGEPAAQAQTQAATTDGWAPAPQAALSSPGLPPRRSRRQPGPLAVGELGTP